MTSLLDVALACIARGWYVFPCWPRTKKPTTAHGWHDASADEARVRAWWTQTPDANPAIACNQSNLAVLDIDHGLAGPDDLDSLDFPPTYAVRTGRRDSYGVQLYYSGAIPDVGLWKQGACEGQIKSLGGYVMAAGCIHPESYATYEVLWDRALGPTPDIVRNLRTVSLPVKTNGLMEKIPEGAGRHAALTSVAGKLRASGLDADAIYAALVPLNDSMCDVPVPEEDLEHIADSMTRYAVGELEPTVTIGSKVNEQPEPAKLPERVRPDYPIASWEGTVVAEFAKLCANDNNIPRKMYAEAFRCALGAVVGDRISCPGVEGALPRSYTVIVAPKGKGKGTAIRRAVRFFTQAWGSAILSLTPGLLSGERDFVWKPRGIGAWIAAASSVPGMARLCKELDSAKSKPHMAWGNTLPRILSVHEEMKTFLSTLFIEGGVGSGMEGVLCQLWDDVVFHGTATGTRDALYGEMMFSMLCGVTEQDWFDLLSRGDAVGGGLMSRFNIIGTEGEFENVSRMQRPPTRSSASGQTTCPKVPSA